VVVKGREVRLGLTKGRRMTGGGDKGRWVGEKKEVKTPPQVEGELVSFETRRGLGGQS